MTIYATLKAEPLTWKRYADGKYRARCHGWTYEIAKTLVHGLKTERFVVSLNGDQVAPPCRFLRSAKIVAAADARSRLSDGRIEPESKETTP